jgi:hypothetical protein
MGVLLQGFFKLLPDQAVPSPADGDPSVPWWWDHLASQAAGIAVNTQPVTQDFDGAADLDLLPAMNGASIQVGRIWRAAVRRNQLGKLDPTSFGYSFLCSKSAY